MPAPNTATVRPTTMPSRRPLRAMSAASGVVPAAKPSVPIAVASPLHRADPRISSAASAVTVNTAMNPVRFNAADRNSTPSSRIRVRRSRSDLSVVALTRSGCLIGSRSSTPNPTRSACVHLPGPIPIVPIGPEFRTDCCNTPSSRRSATTPGDPSQAR